MIKRTLAAIGTALAAVALLAPAAQAQFGIESFDVRFYADDPALDPVALHRGEGGEAVQAGSHPFAMETFFEVRREETAPTVFEVQGGDVRDAIFEQARGFIGDATAAPPCSSLDFIEEDCPDGSAVGITAALVQKPDDALPAAIYSVSPPPGVPVRLGFIIQDVPVVIDVSLKQSPHYNVRAGVLNAPQPLTVYGSAVQLWGVPADPAHDFIRGSCAKGAFPDPGEVLVGGILAPVDKGQRCPAGNAQRPLLTLPRRCAGPRSIGYELRSWTGNRDAGALALADLKGCDKLPFDPEISSRATVDSAATGSGLDFEIDFEEESDPGSEGLIDPDGIAASEMKEIAVTLPRGVTVNPSIAEGLEVCTLSDLDRETIDSDPGEGCPEASKIGTVEVDTPIVEQRIGGSVFLAAQDDPDTAAPENPFDTDIAFYIVLRNKELGALVKVPAKVEPDPETGQLITTATDIPQIPFFRFRFHFREGQRAPLISPPDCGTHTTVAEFVPWARPGDEVRRSARFEIDRGPGGGPCPPGGAPPFAPGFQAGTANNDAASYSPFLMRLTRSDGHQDITRFSAILPPGVLGRLAGVDRCPEAQIALARTKSGRAELRSPSCPANSLIGHTLAGAGVGSSLTFVPGSVHLAGPYLGAPLSVAAVVPAVAGPFDVGTVVVRVALDVDPRSGEVIVDGNRSDPIPHLLRGIPLAVRDLRVAVDRPGFTLNPTSCDPESTRATVFGSGLDLFSYLDDFPVPREARFQAAGCQRLGFKPRLGLRLRGGTRRGANPALLAVLRPRPGEANIERTVVRLPRSAFLDQAHIRTICTRVQFAADACPKGAIYGRVVAHTPLLDEPLRGPAYLRSSSNKLPDLVFDLKGIVDIETAARIDSIRGGIRATFPAIPDAPLDKVVVRMQGGKKGLIVNSRNLCASKNRAHVRLDAHNGKRAVLQPVVRPRCKKRR